ncbi:hypothetical protein ABES23_06090 [Peribacillus frigoritolerans]|uniref:phosphoribosyltransferase n=1 Tax=Peribacillus frigoritolerans TaxID=450367 RepID=UPI003D2B9398
MKTVVIFPTATLLNKNGEVYNGVRELITNIYDAGDDVIFLSNNRNNLVEIIEEFEFATFVRRSDIRGLIDESEETLFILVGSSDVDLYLASSKKILLINPQWSYVQQEKAVKYGFAIRTPQGLERVLRILKNHNAWFYTLELDEATEVYSLTRANYYYVESQSEVEILKGFENLLKEGNKQYFKVLLYHFIGAIVNNPMFREIDIWAIMPSSKKTNNKDMEDLKERARLLMGKRYKEPLFLRHTQVTKSRDMNQAARLYCDRHFDSIIINPVYQGKLQGKNICVLDDYLTNGTSFETLRNLLRHEGVNQILFVSMGRFQRGNGIDYLKQDYYIVGNVYERSYEYVAGEKHRMYGNFNTQARLDLRTLYDIIRS